MNIIFYNKYLFILSIFIFFHILIIFFKINTTLADSSTRAFKNELLGGRASTMGGAYLGISDDSLGCFYNPAGTAYAAGNSLSGSGNIYSVRNNELDLYANPNNTYSEKGSSLLANYFSILNVIDNYAYCFSFGVPENTSLTNQKIFYGNISDSSISEQSSLNTTSFQISTRYDDHRYIAGPSFAIALSDSFSIGMTINFHLRKAKRIILEQI